MISTEAESPVAEADALPILVVDDDVSLARTVCDVLRIHGYDSVSANTASRGLELVAEGKDPFPVALVDLRLPDMGGLELISKLHDVASLTEIVILTGNASLESAIAALRENSYDYLVKPVPPELLVSTVQRGVQRWQHRSAEEDLRRDRERFQLLVEALSEVVTVVLPDGRIQYQSPSAQRTLGYGPGALARSEFLHHVMPSDRERVKEALNAAAKSAAQSAAQSPAERATGFNRPFEFHFRTADGAWCLLESVARRLHPDPEAPVVVTSRDITERRRLEDELRQAQKMESIGRLAGGIAHDFNNQLTAILSSASLAAWHDDVPEPVMEELEEIRLAGQRAARLTRQLLIFSRKDFGEPANVDLNQLIGEMHSMLRRLIPEDIALATELDPALPPVYADGTQLEQVLLNLVVNARDAMPAAGGRIVLRTRYLPDGIAPPDGVAPDDVAPDGTAPDGTAPDGTAPADANADGGRAPAVPLIVLEVEDDGEGMSEEVLARVFEPFFTTKGQGYGTGLGLATSYGIITRAGGGIRAKSRIGEGTVFEVVLPASSILDEFTEGAAVGKSDRKPQGHERILLVEDEDAVRRVLERILSHSGYRVVTAKSGVDAIRLVTDSEKRSESFDLVITDLIMPGMSGPEVAATIKELQPGVRILFTSGYADGDVVTDEGLPFGGDLVSKPVEADDLIRRVRQALNRDAGPGGGGPGGSVQG